jgi:hypothetical protein
MDGDAELVPPTIKEKLLFYTTTFFVLLAIFSLFAFLFLVPFVIEPALETIFHDFDENPAFCFTVDSLELKSIPNCSSWSSCREGCTKEVFQCTQIYVSYKLPGWEDRISAGGKGHSQTNKVSSDTGERFERAIREYDYDDTAVGNLMKDDGGISDTDSFMEYPDEIKKGLQDGNNSEFFYTYAELRPNIKGCGYPPFLNCTIWTKKYKDIGANFSCYYARADPLKVITDLDLWQNTLNLVYSTAIPIPSFIISVIYLAFAYFKIYNEDEENAPLDKNAEDIDVEGGDEDDLANVGGEENPITENGGIDCNSGEEDDGELVVDEDGNTILVKAQLPNGTTTASIANGSKPITPTSDLNSFGHQLKVKMADEQSRDSLIDGGMLSTSGSLQG